MPDRRAQHYEPVLSAGFVSHPRSWLNGLQACRRWPSTTRPPPQFAQIRLHARLLVDVAGHVRVGLGCPIPRCDYIEIVKEAVYALPFAQLRSRCHKRIMLRERIERWHEGAPLLASFALLYDVVHS